MPVPALPTSYVRVQILTLADNASFTGSIPFTLNSTTNKWGFNVASYHAQQLDALATAIEQLYQQDFSALALEDQTKNIDAAIDAVDGVTVLNPAFTVELTQVNDAPGVFNIGTASNISVGMAWSLRTAIRVNLGIGTPWTP